MMDLKPEDVQTLQEKLILVYKFIKQDKMFKKFFGEDLNPKDFKDNDLLGKFMEMEDAEDILKNCIIELEEIKKGEKIKKEIKLQDILEVQDIEFLCHKYGLKNLDDVDKLDLKLLFKLF